MAARKVGREDDAHPHNGETWLGRPRYGRNRTSTYRRKERHGRLYSEVKETVGNGKGVREKAPKRERAVCVPTVTVVCMTWANGTEDIADPPILSWGTETETDCEEKYSIGLKRQ